jgi:hypothetical protein
MFLLPASAGSLRLLFTLFGSRRILNLQLSSACFGLLCGHHYLENSISEVRCCLGGIDTRRQGNRSIETAVRALSAIETLSFFLALFLSFATNNLLIHPVLQFAHCPFFKASRSISSCITRRCTSSSSTGTLSNFSTQSRRRFVHQVNSLSGKNRSAM